MLSVFFFLCCDFGFFFEGQLCIGAVKVKLKGPLTCAYNESTAGCKGTMPREGGGGGLPYGTDGDARRKF